MRHENKLITHVQWPADVAQSLVNRVACRFAVWIHL